MPVSLAISFIDLPASASGADGLRMRTAAFGRNHRVGENAEHRTKTRQHSGRDRGFVTVVHVPRIGVERPLGHGIVEVLATEAHGVGLLGGEFKIAESGGGGGRHDESGSAVIPQRLTLQRIRAQEMSQGCAGRKESRKRTDNGPGGTEPGAVVAQISPQEIANLAGHGRLWAESPNPLPHVQNHRHLTPQHERRRRQDDGRRQPRRLPRPRSRQARAPRRPRPADQRLPLPYVRESLDRLGGGTRHDGRHF